MKPRLPYICPHCGVLATGLVDTGGGARRSGAYGLVWGVVITGPARPLGAGPPGGNREGSRAAGAGCAARRDVGARPYGSVCDVVIAGPDLPRGAGPPAGNREGSGVGQVLVPYPPCDIQ